MGRSQVRNEFRKVRHWDMRLVQVESISGWGFRERGGTILGRLVESV